MIRLLNQDCMTAMREMPDKAYELAIVDPPYGIGISNNPVRQRHTKKAWDFEIPGDDYFEQLFRVSHQQIIWGGNYYSLPAAQGFLIWDKKQPENFSLAMCELAWMSFKSPAKIWKCSVLTEKSKIHPTQKPVALYKWLLTHYAKPGDKILDTHGGSGSICIACDILGFDLDWYEIDAEYFQAAKERLERHQRQQALPLNEECTVITQEALSL